MTDTARSDAAAPRSLDVAQTLLFVPATRLGNYSLWLDLQILFIETLPAVVKGKGAY